MRTPFLVTSTLAVILTLTGCVQQNDDIHPFARAIPAADDVRIHLPDEGFGARGVGQIAQWYAVTREVTLSLNGSTEWALLLVHSIVQLPPTSTSGDTATWGPYSEALDPAEYRLIVTALPNGSYDWHLDGRNKTEAGAAFETVMSGNGVPSVPSAAGRGTIVLDLDASERVNPIDNDGRGVMQIAYDLAARTIDIEISTVEERDGGLRPITQKYAYAASPDGSGNMVLSTHADTDDAGPAAEDAVLRSRWLANGAGRADVRITSGDVPGAQLTASECWNTSFRRVFYADSANSMPMEGDPAACVFADQDLP